MKENSSFFVSESISHLINEESFLEQNTENQDSFFATSDIIAKVTAEDRMFYADVVEFIPNKSIKIKSGINAFKVLNEAGSVNLQILIKDDAINNNKLYCEFKQFNEISRGDYIYCLRICENIKRGD
jgi:hypothetical protein